MITHPITAQQLNLLILLHQGHYTERRLLGREPYQREVWEIKTPNGLFTNRSLSVSLHKLVALGLVARVENPVKHRSPFPVERWEITEKGRERVPLIPF